MPRRTQFSPFVSTFLATAFVLAGTTLGARPAHATPSEFFNEFDMSPSTGNPTDFEITFAGAPPIPAQNAADAATDPFANLNDLVAGGLTSNASVITSYNPITNQTTVTYSGSPLKSGTQMHFGLNDGPLLSPYPPNNLSVVSKTWTYPTSSGISPVLMPAANIDLIQPHPIAGNATEYLVIYLEAGFASGGPFYGSWFEVPFIAGPTNTIVWNAAEGVLEIDGLDESAGGADVAISNTEGEPLSFQNYGYMFSSTEIPLDDLNFTDMPPPENANSPFTAFNGPATLASGDYSGNIPEPASLGLLAAGLFGLAGARFRARRS